eukprot:scaffold2585_cov368-Prasinococcus_capsulatus_cf.AAC.16
MGYHSVASLGAVPCSSRAARSHDVPWKRWMGGNVNVEAALSIATCGEYSSRDSLPLKTARKTRRYSPFRWQ